VLGPDSDSPWSPPDGRRRGGSATPATGRLWLLPSGPDQVHGAASRGTSPSTRPVLTTADRAVYQPAPTASGPANSRASAAATRIIKAGWAVNPDPAGGKRNSLERESYNLLRRFDLQRSDIYRHRANPTIPFDSNQTERGVRMVKFQQTTNPTRT